jgi:hypothetical protein
MASSKTQALVLKKYIPDGMPAVEDFELVEVPAPSEPGDGHAIIDLVYLSVDPYMRGEWGWRAPSLSMLWQRHHNHCPPQTLLSHGHPLLNAHSLRCC